MKADLYKTAQRYLPSGVNSPVRAFKAVGGNPIFIQKGKGSSIWDEDGNRYVDFCTSWGALLFGHAPQGLVKALKRKVSRGTSFGTATYGEVECARQIRQFFPSMEKLRLVNSGTEAVMSAVRLARGFTGRNKILKIDGGYHGHVDSLLVKAGSGGATFGLPDSAGIPKDLAKHTLTIAFNDIAAVEKVFKRAGKSIAAFILEPVPANMGVVTPRAGYLQKVRAITQRYGALLILDEVITGFRVSRGGAQAFYDVKPDLTCLGKILGGGMPLAAFGGRAEIMNELAPNGKVYQAGTLSGNPLAVSAANWVLGELAKGRARGPQSILGALNRKAGDFFLRLQKMAVEEEIPLQLNSLGSMFTIFFTADQVTDYKSAKTSDTRLFGRFFRECLKRGVYLSPSQFEGNFISTAHSERDLDRVLSVFKKAFSKL